MAHVALFHSVLGLRSVEVLAAERLRRAGHHIVTTPDLFGGETATTLDEGFGLVERVGWTTVVERTRRALVRPSRPEAECSTASAGGSRRQPIDDYLADLDTVLAAQVTAAAVG